jgi:hypothetical protein
MCGGGGMWWGGGGGEEGGEGAGYRWPDVDVGPSLQQDRHGTRITAGTGPHQGRCVVLQRREIVVKTKTVTAYCVEVYTHCFRPRC